MSFEFVEVMTIPYEDKIGALQSNKAGDVNLTQECTLRGRDGLATAANEDRAVGEWGACKLLSLNSVPPLLRMAWSCDCAYIVSQPFAAATRLQRRWSGTYLTGQL